MAIQVTHVRMWAVRVPGHQYITKAIGWCGKRMFKAQLVMYQIARLGTMRIWSLKQSVRAFQIAKQ